MSAESLEGRLVLTATRARWHIAQPQTPYFTLCGVQSRPAGINYPTYSDVCKRCQRAYDRES